MTDKDFAQVLRRTADGIDDHAAAVSEGRAITRHTDAFKKGYKSGLWRAALSIRNRAHALDGRGEERADVANKQVWRKVYAIEQQMPVEPTRDVRAKTAHLERQDSGQALIATLGDSLTGMFVRVQSWDSERVHEQFSQLLGRNVRVTVEVLDV